MVLVLSRSKSSKDDHDVAVVLLWKSSVEAVPNAEWALLRLAQYELEQEDEKCLVHLHHLIRLDPRNSSYWAALGMAYNIERKFMSAQKALQRAVDLGNNTESVHF